MKERPMLFNSEMVRAIRDGRKTQTRRKVNRLFGFGHVSGFQKSRVVDHDFSFRLRDGLWKSGSRQQVTEHCPYGRPGDLLWVRENFTYWECPDDPPFKRGQRRKVITQEEYDEITRNKPEPGEDFLEYTADGARRSFADWPFSHPIYEHCIGKFGKTIPSIHMPRWASRITLEITDVRVERLQSISEQDAEREGVDPANFHDFSDAEIALLDYPSSDRMTPYRNSFSLLWEGLHGQGSWSANPWVWVVCFRVLGNLGQRTAA